MTADYGQYEAALASSVGGLRLDVCDGLNKYERNAFVARVKSVGL